jgi:hypothetical protein
LKRLDRRRRTIVGRAVAPAATHLQHMQNALDHPSVIHLSRARLVLGRGGSIAAHASSDNQNSAMRHLP